MTKSKPIYYILSTDNKYSQICPILEEAAKKQAKHMMLNLYLSVDLSSSFCKTCIDKLLKQELKINTIACYNFSLNFRCSTLKTLEKVTHFNNNTIMKFYL